MNEGLMTSTVDHYAEGGIADEKKNTLLRSIAILETSLFWDTVKQNTSVISAQINESLSLSVRSQKKILNPQDYVLLRFLFRLNSFRMGTSFRPFEVEKILRETIPHPAIETLAKMAVIIHRTRNSATGAILIGGLLGSCRGIVQEASPYAEAWGTNSQRSNRDLINVLSFRGSADSFQILSLVQEIAIKVRVLYSFVWACPFISEYLHPKAVLAALADIVDTTPLKVKTIKNRFLTDSSFQVSTVVNELHRTRKLALITSHIFICYIFPDLCPNLFHQTDIVFTRRIEETCNNLCAAAIRASGLKFSEWIRCLYRGEFIDKSKKSMERVEIDSRESIKNAIQSAKKILSESCQENFDSKPCSFFNILSDLLETDNEILKEPKEKSDKATVTYTPEVQQLLEIFPHWNVAFVKLILSRYENNVEEIINEAFSNNLPPDLQEKLEKYCGSDSDSYTAATADDQAYFSLFTNNIVEYRKDNVSTLPNTTCEFGKNYDPFQFDNEAMFFKYIQSVDDVYNDEPEV